MRAKFVNELYFERPGSEQDFQDNLGVGIRPKIKQALNSCGVNNFKILPNNIVKIGDTAFDGKKMLDFMEDYNLKFTGTERKLKNGTFDFEIDPYNGIPIPWKTKKIHNLTITKNWFVPISHHNGLRYELKPGEDIFDYMRKQFNKDKAAKQVKFNNRIKKYNNQVEKYTKLFPLKDSEIIPKLDQQKSGTYRIIYKLPNYDVESDIIDAGSTLQAISNFLNKHNINRTSQWVHSIRGRYYSGYEQSGYTEQGFIDGPMRVIYFKP